MKEFLHPTYGWVTYTGSQSQGRMLGYIRPAEHSADLLSRNTACAAHLVKEWRTV